MKKPKQVVSVRMETLDLKKLQALAAVDDNTMAAQIQAAVHQYIATRIREKGFRKKMEAAKKRQMTLLDVLSN